ncbi:MAG: SRPBCC family protein [Elusimicrobiota bacterium]
MKTHELHHTQLIKKSLPDVFSFFENPANLAKITPPELGFKILTPTPIQMGKGSLIDYTVCVMRFPIRWTSLISEYEPPHKFVDVQLKGPYSFWHHTHLFEEHPEGTLIKDIVHYCLPFGLVGNLLHGLFVKRQLHGIFAYREKVISDFFEKEYR